LRTRIIAALGLAAALFTTGCEDELDFGFGDWVARVDTVTLYTLEQPAYQGLPAAFDLVTGTARRVEDRNETGRWDVVLTGGVGGEPLMLTPLGALLSLETQAAVAPIDGETFDGLDIAPRDTLDYVFDSSVIVREDSVYVLRSRATGERSGGCIRFGKIEALEVDPVIGSVTFRAIVNPNCNDRDLVPPED